ncbi:hypothetical protein, partial [Salmonella sp. s51228]|uniref:hypothetical protein n=1 Tax=Salmonella sp. s51228 TaxID=3159652 RepID=UPI003980A972
MVTAPLFLITILSIPYGLSISIDTPINERIPGAQIMFSYNLQSDNTEISFTINYDHGQENTLVNSNEKTISHIFPAGVYTIQMT